MIIKKIIYILIIANIGLLQAQYTAIPDPCFEFYLIEQGIDSEGTLDGQILTNDVADIVDLMLIPSICFITDLTGIQDFTSLETLDCSFNSLTSIDISQNLQLRELRCSSNELTSIDISNNLLLKKLIVPVNQISTFISGNNSNLEHFEISNNNLTILDVSSFTNLTGLGCGHNNIESLILTQNTNLEQLGVGLNSQLNFFDIRNGNNNSITFFDTTETPNLTCIFVDNVDYSTTNWLDIDPNTTFVETELECETLAITDFSLNNIAVYPNPVKEILFIENPNTINIEFIKVYNMLGQQVLVKNGNFNQINLTQLKPAMYLVTIKTKNGNINTKVIKK